MKRAVLAGFVFGLLAVVAVVAGCDRDPAKSVRIESHSAPSPAPSTATATPALTGGGQALTPAQATVSTAPPTPTPQRTPAAGPSHKGADPARADRATVASASHHPATAAWHPAGCPPPPQAASGASTLTVRGPCAFEHRGPFTCEPLADDFYISMSRKAAHGGTLMAFINVERYKGAGDYKGAQMFVSVQDKSTIYRWSNDDVAITLAPDGTFALLAPTRLEAEPVLVGCTGPMDNFQCSGRGDSAGLSGTRLEVSGKLACAAHRAEAAK